MMSGNVSMEKNRNSHTDLEFCAPTYKVRFSFTKQILIKIKMRELFVRLDLYSLYNTLYLLLNFMLINRDHYLSRPYKINGMYASTYSSSFDELKF